jgi:hypothetical protein
MKDIQKIKEFFSQPVNETKETAIDKIKKQLDALGVKYEMSTTDKVRPFKVIYRPINKSDEFYDKFEDIVDLFNLKGFVKPSMNENKEEDKVEFKKGNTVFDKHTKAKLKVTRIVKDRIYTVPFNFPGRAEEWYKAEDLTTKSFFTEQEEDAVDTITMDVPLFLRMLEYSREDASQDMDLHDVTEKAISLGKERGILQMDDYEEIIGATEDINELSDYFKRRKAQDDYAVNKKDKPAKPYNPNSSGKTDYMKRREKELSERISEALNKINEELCPAGKAYIKKRKAAGEKSSAYLSGRAVKVCKGQMSGKAKKK